MIVLCWGENSYAVLKEKRKILAKAQRENTPCFCFKSEKIPGIGQLNQILATKDFFSPKKQIVFSDISAKDLFPKLKKEIIDFCQKKEVLKSEDFSVFFFYKNPNKKERFFNEIKELPIKKIEYSFSRQLEEENYLRKEAESLKIKIKKEGIRKLSSLLDNQCFEIVNEMKKLNAYKKGELITEEDIEKHTEFKIMTDIFRTIDAVGRGDKRIALSLLNLHLKKGEDPYYLFSMINYQFRNILKIKDALEEGVSYNQVSQATGVNPYVAKKVVTFSQRFTLERLKGIYQKIASLDWGMKKGEIEPITALNLLVAFS